MIFILQYIFTTLLPTELVHTKLLHYYYLCEIPQENDYQWQKISPEFCEWLGILLRPTIIVNFKYFFYLAFPAKYLFSAVFVPFGKIFLHIIFFFFILKMSLIIIIFYHLFSFGKRPSLVTAGIDFETINETYYRMHALMNQWRWPYFNWPLFVSNDFRPAQAYK